MIHHAIMTLWNCIQEADALDLGTKKNSATDLMIFKHFKIANRLGRALAFIEVQWKAPSTGWIKINMDGVAKESPGMAGRGGIFRTYRGFCK